MKIINMQTDRLEEYAKLYVSVFNEEPWNDSWTDEKARIRIGDMMCTNTFVGKAIYEEGMLIGMIWGQREQYFDGIHFQLQEFCVRTDFQQKGYGKALLLELKEELNQIGVTNIFLITSRQESTEGYYQKRGFRTSDFMIVMSQNQ